ncbi:MAG: nucleotidyltransferase family protein [Gemmatimonadaceae bacterium]
MLAAGQGIRFGSQKLLVPIAGMPLVRLTVENVLAADVQEVVVVVGRDADSVRTALSGLPVRFAENPNYADGMSTSVRVGIDALAAGTNAALIALGDQPGVTLGIANRLIEAQRISGKPIVVPVYAGQRGTPVLFRSDIFPELGAIHGDQGARELVMSDLRRVEMVDFPFAPPGDVDTREDYSVLLRLMGR